MHFLDVELPRHTDGSTKAGDSRSDYQKRPSMRPVIAEKRHIISPPCVLSGGENVGSESWDRNRGERAPPDLTGSARISDNHLEKRGLWCEREEGGRGERVGKGRLRNR